MIVVKYFYHTIKYLLRILNFQYLFVIVVYVLDDFFLMIKFYLQKIY